MCNNIVIYNGLCTSYGSFLLQCAHEALFLREHSIGYIQRRPSPVYGIACHEDLPRLLAQQNQLTHWQREQLVDWVEDIVKTAENYSVLFLTVSCANAAPLIALRNCLRAQPSMKRASIKLLMHISHQAAFIEQRLRFAPNHERCEVLKQHYFSSDIANPENMLHQLQRAYGRSNIFFCSGEADPSEMPYSLEAQRMLTDLLQSPPLSSKAELRCRILLKARETRHIQLLYSCLNNRWPVPDLSASLLTALEKAESLLAGENSLDFRSILSPEDVQWISDKVQPGNLQLAQIFPAAQTLCPPALQDTDYRGWSPYTGLSSKAAASIAACLPQEVRDPLREALLISEQLLNTDQRTLLDALSAVHPQVSFRPPAPKEVKVSVLVQAYNQEAYIAEAIESILAQKTDFPYNIIIVDDASSDGTRDIIDNYARKYGCIRPIFLQRRANTGQNTCQLFLHAKAPYVALCDGDDYFCDESKLQRQADFLDGNAACALCFHPVRVVWEDGSPEDIYPDMSLPLLKGRTRFGLRDLLQFNFIQTNSVMYRWRFRNGLPDWFDPLLVPGDWYWHLLHAELGSIGFLNDTMSVYRRHKSSMFWRPKESSSEENRIKFGLGELRLYEQLRVHFQEKAEAPLQRLITGVFADLMRHYLHSGDRAPMEKALRYYPEMGRIFLEKARQLE